jgi:hypothetical protein
MDGGDSQRQVAVISATRCDTDTRARRKTGASAIEERWRTEHLGATAAHGRFTVVADFPQPATR